METLDPDYQKRTEVLFQKAPFLKNLGVQLIACGPGWCEAGLEIQNYHKKQDHLVHAGVIATLADHCAGGAAGTLVAADEIILTVEFKINLLRPGKGTRLRARATVLKPGRRFVIAESEVYATVGQEEKLLAKAMVTLAVLPKTGEVKGLFERWAIDKSDWNGVLKTLETFTGNEMDPAAAEKGRNRPLWWILGTSFAFEAVLLLIAGIVFCRRDF